MSVPSLQNLCSDSFLSSPQKKLCYAFFMCRPQIRKMESDDQKLAFKAILELIRNHVNSMVKYEVIVGTRCYEILKMESIRNFSLLFEGDKLQFIRVTIHPKRKRSEEAIRATADTNLKIIGVFQELFVPDRSYYYIQSMPMFCDYEKCLPRGEGVCTVEGLKAIVQKKPSYLYPDLKRIIPIDNQISDLEEIERALTALSQVDCEISKVQKAIFWHLETFVLPELRKKT